MKQSQLIEVLQTFGRKEWIEATKFVQSPIHNSRTDVTDLFRYLKKVVPKNQEDKLLKEVAFAAVFPGKIYDEKEMRYCMSFLFQTIKKYLTYAEFAADELQQNILLVQALRKRGLNRSFDIEIRKTAAQMEHYPFRNQDFHYYSFRLHEEKYKQSTTRSRTETQSFQELSDETTLYFLVKKLQQACIALSHKTVSGVDYRLDLLNAVLQQVEQQGYSTYPAITLYYQMYKALTQKGDIYSFEKLRKLIRENQHWFPKSEVKSIYLLALNYCIQQWNAGKAAFLQEAFQLYQEGLQQEVFIENGNLSRFTYNNIVLAGLGLEEYEWTEAFLKNYKNKIEEKYRESAFSYNLATLHYRKKEYTKAMPLLQQTEFKDVLYNLEARKMLLKIYFDLDETDALDSLLESFKNFIYRQKELGYHRENYLNLIHFTQKLLRLDSSNAKMVAQLKSELQTTEKLAERGWLLEKLPSDNT